MVHTRKAVFSSLILKTFLNYGKAQESEQQTKPNKVSYWAWPKWGDNHVLSQDEQAPDVIPSRMLEWGGKESKTKLSENSTCHLTHCPVLGTSAENLSGKMTCSLPFKNLTTGNWWPYQLQENARSSHGASTGQLFVQNDVRILWIMLHICIDAFEHHHQMALGVSLRPPNHAGRHLMTFRKEYKLNTSEARDRVFRGPKKLWPELGSKTRCRMIWSLQKLTVDPKNLVTSCP